MKVTKRDLQISMALIGILAAVFSYFFVFTKLQDKTALLKTENIGLAAHTAQLETIFANQNQYIADTEKMTGDTDTIISDYDAGHSREDAIMYLYNMQAAGINDIEVNNINMSNPEAVMMLSEETVPGTDTAQAAAPEADTGEAAAAQTAGTDQAAADANQYTLPVAQKSKVELYKVPINYGFQVSYNGLKDVMNYIYETGGRKNVDSLTLSFDSATGKLSGTMLMNMYFMTGTDKIYAPETIPSMSSGVGNIFRTVEAGAAGENDISEDDLNGDISIEGSQN